MRADVDGRLVDLSHITMPVLNVYAKDDHITPPATSGAAASQEDIAVDAATVMRKT